MSPPGERPMAMSVLGAVPADELGVTLIHEHLHMDATPLLKVHGYDTTTSRPFDHEAAAEARWDPGSHADNYRLTEDELVAAELAPFLAAGGRTVVDQTPPALGRDPVALRDIAEASGAVVIMGTGHYLAATHAGWIAEVDEEELCRRLLRECLQGDAESGIRPGIIGELGTSSPVEAAEDRVLRAAAAAARESGLAVSVHLHPWGRTGAQVADSLLAEGLPPDRIALGHLTTAWHDERYLRDLAARGVRLAFDLFGFDHSLLGVGRWPPSDRQVAETVVGLFKAGLGSQVLISHDIGVRSRLLRYGSWGYAHICRHVVPLLMELGLTESDTRLLLVDNPAALLSLAVPPA